MIDPARTWALVIGIDAYDAPTLRQLTGAVADAVAAVEWLRKLGVPATQILLHASPTAASTAALQGLAYKDAREPTIWSSVRTLGQVQNGERLFIFLTGHGLYDPTTQRLFLTQDADSPDYMNLGIAGHTDYFLSMSFERQFLFMDGCLNYPYSDRSRPTMRAHIRVPPATPNPRNSMIACFAASQDELAVEIAGRGAFMRRLFEAIDPSQPLLDAVDLDFATGTQSLNLRKVMDDYVIPQVRADALQAGQNQNPSLFPHGSAGAHTDRFALFDLPPPSTCKVTVMLTPPAACPDVESVRLSFEDRPYWSRTLPQPPVNVVAMPFVSTLPTGHDIKAQCRVKPTASWDVVRAKEELRTDMDATVVFQLSPRPPVLPAPPSAPPPPFGGLPGGGPPRPPGSWGGPSGERFSVKVLDRSGNPYPALGHPGGWDDRYTDVAKVLGRTTPADFSDVSDAGGGVIIELHEDGPEFLVPETEIDHGAEIVASWSSAIRQVVPKEFRILTTIRGSQDPTPVPNLLVEFAPGGARRLAGPLAEIRLVSIGSPELDLEGPLWRPRPDGGVELGPGRSGVGDLSLAELERSGPGDVDPGPTRVRIDLPWGSWTKLLHVPDTGVETLRLPPSIGRPPLRVALGVDAAGSVAHVLGVEAPDTAHLVVPGWLRVGLAGERRVPFPPAEVRADGAYWSVPIPSEALGVAAATPTPPWLARIEGPTTVVFPLYGNRSLAVDRSDRAARVEPLSDRPVPEWDLLVASGRLDVLTKEDFEQLARAKWDDPVLGLAGGYAAYASRAWGYLQEVVGNLQNLQMTTLDVELLRVAAELGDSDRRPELDTIVKRVSDGDVPLFRWGVDLASHLLDRGGASGPWRSPLESVRRNLWPTSVWTAWVE